MRYSLEFEWERWVPPEFDPINCNSDVTVRLEDGRVYTGTFFTPKNVETLMQNWQRSGECAGGEYFWAKNAVIVRRLDEPTIRKTIDDLIADGHLEDALAARQ